MRLGEDAYKRGWSAELHRTAKYEAENTSLVGIRHAILETWEVTYTTGTVEGMKLTLRHTPPPNFSLPDICQMPEDIYVWVRKIFINQ